MKKLQLFTFLLLLSALSIAQDLPDMKHFKALAPRNIGPAGMSGRVTAIDVDLSDPDIIYVGTASGGVWKSDDGGIDWTPIFDDAPLQSVGALAINQHNPDDIWVGTGEGNPRNSHNSGKGLFRTRDGGQTWENMGLEKTINIHRIIIHRDNPDIVYIGAMGSIWGPNEERGVFRTQDGGQTWEHILSVGDGVGIADLVVDPSNPEKLIAAMWEFDRDPWFFNSGGASSGLYMTYDGGDNWVQRTDKDGLPKGDLGRMGLAFAPSSPNIIYALIEAKVNGLYKSVDGGRKWSLVSEKNIGNRPFYYSDIFVDPVNENRIYNLYTYVSLSEDGGKSFKVILDYSTNVHPDHHAFWVHPNDPNYLIEGNDGGLNISRDRGKSWRFVTNIPVAQFYHISHDMEIPYNIGGGMQDNGSWVGPSQAWKQGGITNSDWQEVLFGDGFDLQFDPKDSRYLYGMSQGGFLNRVDRQTGASQFIRPVHPEGERLRFNWDAAMALDPFDDNSLYFGSQFVHKSTDQGNSWTIISPDLTTNDPEKQKADESGGLTYDATQAENYTTILAIAPDLHDKQTIWVATDDGNLQITRDGGDTWTNMANKLVSAGADAGSWIPYIELSKTNKGEAFVIVNDYRRNNFEPMAFHTKDYGKTWTSIIDKKQVSGYTKCIVQDPEVANLLWLGTDHGLYFSIDYGKNWTQWTEGFPSVTTADMKIHPREHDLIIGTFGRAAWVLDDTRPIREIAKTKAAVLDQAFAAFPSPDAYVARYRSYQGVRFIADGEFVGQNRPFGALLSLWVQPKKEMSDEEKKEVKKEEADQKETTDKKAKKGAKDKVYIDIVDAQGDTIRNFSRKLKDGFNRFTWNLRANGVRMPSRRKVKPDADPPTGMFVSPGTYKLYFTYGEHHDSTLVQVHSDPRLPYSQAAQDKKLAAYKEWSGMITAATDGFNLLQDIRSNIDLVEKSLVNAPDSTQTQIKDLGKALRDSIDQIELLYMEPKDVKGIKRNPDALGNDLWTSNYYLQTSVDKPSQMFEFALATAKKKTNVILDKINALVEEDFAAYRKEVEAIQVQLFKDFSTIKME